MTAAQHTSLRVSATEPLTGASSPLSVSEYEDAAAAPTAPPNASVTIIAPAAVKSNPYGVLPEDLIVVGPAASPRSSTAYVLMLSVPRSVTASVRPSRLNETWAGSASAALGGRSEPSNSTSRPPSILNPAMFGVPLLST